MAEPEKDILEKLSQEARQSLEPTWTERKLLGEVKGVEKVRYSHDAMIDVIIQNPAVSQGEIAGVFGYTPGWVSQIIASDAFQARLAERKNELVDPTIRATVEERFKSLVIQSLDILRQKLERPAHLIPDNLVLKGLEIASKAAGYGARMEQPAQPLPGGKDRLDVLADRLTGLLTNKRQEVIYENVQVVEEAQIAQSEAQGATVH